MKHLLFYGYEILSAFLPFSIVFVMIRNTQKKQSGLLNRSAYLVILVFSIYIIAVYHLTGTGTLYDGFLYQLEFRPEQFNIIPFSNGMDITSFFNILLFIPLGFLNPFIWKRMDHIIAVLGVSFFTTTLIELSQLLNNRRTDIDDIILNLAGAVIGFGLYRTIKKLGYTKRQIDCVLVLEPIIYILAIFLGRFLLFNEMGIAKLIYGF